VDPSYLSVIAQQELCRLVEELVGSGMQCTGIGGRVVPPEAETAGDEGLSGAGYATWHRDFSRTATQLHEHGPSVYHHQMSETVKAFMAVQEQTDEMGCTSVVEGSHLYVQEPRSAVWDWPPGSTPQEAMEGMVRFVAQPGDGATQPRSFVAVPCYLLTIDVLSDADGPADVAHCAAESLAAGPRDADLLLHRVRGEERGHARARAPASGERRAGGARWRVG